MDRIIISDTDSLYIYLEQTLEDLQTKGIDVSNRDETILKLANYIQKQANEELNKTSHTLFNIQPNTHYFQLKQEVIAKSVLVSGKRRYGMWVTNKEGVVVDEIVLMGIELMKSNMNKLFKTFGETLIKEVLHGTDKKIIDKSIVDFYNHLKTLEPKQLSKPTGVKKIQEYILRKPEGDEIFTPLKKGAKENTRAAVYYNDILRHLKLDKKFESIIDGDKIFITNLKANPYQIDVIAIPTAKIPPELEKFIKDYIDVEQIFESILLNKLRKLYDDVKWSFPILNPFISKFFTFS